MIAPHGGRLIDRMVSGAERDTLVEAAAGMPRINLNAREVADVDMIAVGVMSPLEGFMNKADYDAVLGQKRLAGGLPWGIPIVLATKDGDDASQYGEGKDIALYDGDRLLAVLHCDSMWKADKTAEAKAVLMTDEDAHPGVQYLNNIGDHYLGGRLSVVNRAEYDKFDNYRLDPVDTRTLFAQKGWKSVVAFQTRNPIHRAHEFLTKVALEITDGLLIHPLVGETKSDDIPAQTRMDCYEALMAKYYPLDRVVMSVYPQAMRYAGPREAMLHALCRKNYGCTHFIVGRDHAGVGTYYGTYDAQKIFEEFDASEIGITLLNFEHAFWCKKMGTMATAKTSNSDKEDRVFLSGTAVRAMLAEGTRPPIEFTRPEVADILIDSMKTKVEA